MAGPLLAGAGALLGKGLVSNKFAGTVLGGSVLAGATSAVLDRQGPYPELQEYAMGDPEALRFTIKTGLADTFDNRRDSNILGMADYFYGQPVNPRGIGRTTPVPGQVVLGAHHLRRGY